MQDWLDARRDRWPTEVQCCICRSAIRPKDIHLLIGHPIVLHYCQHCWPFWIEKSDVREMPQYGVPHQRKED